MQQNQVYVIQVNTKNKGGPLALPAPGDALLPSEVKYSASLVRGLGCTHLGLGAVLFLLGVLGSWVEPETCWAGAGIWAGIATIACGICGLLAHHLWYKNYAIKAFLVTSVVSVVISTLAIILTIYALVNRYEHYYYLVERAEKNPWFRPYNQNQEQQLTLSVSANQLVGFILELILAFWSVKIGWKGVRAEEFSSSRRDALCDDLQSVVSLPHHNGQQIPLAALYQLLQAHPELLGSKNINGSLGHPWISGLDDRPSHGSMDYQERVSRFLSHAIEDHNTSFSRSPSVFQGEVRENSPTTRPSSVAGDCEDRGSPSGGSADTLVMCPDPGNEGSQSTAPSKVLNQKIVMCPDPGNEGSQSTAPSKDLNQKIVMCPDPGNEGSQSTAPSKDSNQKIVMCSDPGNEGSQTTTPSKDLNQKTAPERGIGQTDTLKSINQMQATRQRADGQPKGKAPNPKDMKQSDIKEKVEGQKQEIIEIQRTEDQIDSRRQMNAESNENANLEKLTKESKKNTEKKSTEEKKEEALPQPEEQEVTAEITHQGSENVSEEKKAEGEITVKNSKDTKKKSKEKRSSRKKIEEEDPPTPKIEEEDRNHLETRDTSDDERKHSKKEKSKKKSKEKRRMSKERVEEEPSQGQEDDKTQAEKSKDRKSHKEEKHKSRKKEVNTVNDENNANETNENKQNKNRLNETESKDTTENGPVEIIQNGTQSKDNSDTKSEHPDLVQNEKIKKSKKSKRDKATKEKSKTHKEATESNTVPDDAPKDTSLLGQVVDIMPPNEFQDS